GQQLAALHPLLYVLQHGLEKGIALALAEKLQGLQDWQARFDQREKLLVKDDKRGAFDPLLSPPKQTPRGEPSPALDGINQVALLEETIANVLFGHSALQLLEHVPALVRHFDQEFSHELKLPGSSYPGSSYPLSSLAFPPPAGRTLIDR